MRVVDTLAWIEGVVLGARNRAIKDELPKQAEYVVPTIVQLELAKWAARNVSEETADVLLAYTTQCVVLDLDKNIAIRAAELSRDHKLPTADAIIYATALHVDADLLTCDAHFQGLDRVVYVPKMDG
jgi:predicted nucleic acid-binding protein